MVIPFCSVGFREPLVVLSSKQNVNLSFYEDGVK